MKCFALHGHEVVIVTPCEKRYGKDTYCEVTDSINVLHVKTGNLQKCGMIEKGISMMSISRLFCKAIMKHFPNTQFDLLLYSTPPITLKNAIVRIKKKYHLKTYLMLKDIFPQNAVDIGVLSKRGFKGLLYFYFSIIEKQLYEVSDYIGCMSEGNIKYINENYKNVGRNKLSLCPNSLIVESDKYSYKQKVDIREKYGIPTDRKVFVYGGNLGKPQDVPFIIRCIRLAQSSTDAFFVVVGSGTEYGRMKSFYENENPTNLIVIEQLPRDEYELLTASCDVGLVFLDHRFTIPNFPSRILSYMQASLPVVACTDSVTDLRTVIEDGGFGWWCESSDEQEFVKRVDLVCHSNTSVFGKKGREYLESHYTAEISYRLIVDRLE